MPKEITIEDLAKMIAKGFEEVNGKFEGVNKRFDLIDKRLELIEKRLDKVELEIEHLRAGLDMFRRDISELKIVTSLVERIERLEKVVFSKTQSAF